MPQPPQILICKTARKARPRVNGWIFPASVRELLLEKIGDQSVLHLFGGFADFGVRLDIDAVVKPDVIGDAWLPPFARDSFDIVILDPPYVGDFASMGSQKSRCLFQAAAWIARRQVVWFHTIWITHPARLRLAENYIVVVGNQCQVRCLQFFDVPSDQRKMKPTKYFTRGPAIKYNRWLSQPQGLPYG